MDPVKAEFLAIVFVSVGFFTSITSIAYYWFNRGTRKGVGVPPRDLAGLEERLRRIEHAVDAIAIEMERVSEGQRFVTKLLAERRESSAPAAIGAESQQAGTRDRTGRST